MSSAPPPLLKVGARGKGKGGGGGPLVYGGFPLQRVSSVFPFRMAEQGAEQAVMFQTVSCTEMLWLSN